ncbi:MAG TPA: DNA starvation/stationary phase protection protein Dps [Actinomycetota bacterium]|nr:DNA starvation/stationary phase protection protein Dps [Actinomycetota bacterium]
MDTKMFETRIDIPQENRTKLVDLLNARLADISDLYTQAKQAHWNVKGSDFFQLHELYDELAAALLPFIDMIAERATALGGEALGTVRMAASASTLKEFPRDAYASMDSVDALADRYAMMALNLRESADQAEQLEDMDTNDLLIEVSREVDKQLWFLEAHLQKAR